MLRIPVPRNLRVRSSIQLASWRVPARAFLIGAGLIFLGALMIVAGADLLRTVKLIGVLIVLSLIVFELRCWGRSIREVARILIRHYRRPQQFRLDPRMLAFSAETSAAPTTRPPRWKTNV
jgi:hypothetical protein